MTQKDAFETKEERLLNSEDFQLGVSIGKSLGSHELYKEARRAHKMGELEVWLEYNEPKSLEDWDTWNEKYGENYSDRWKEPEEEQEKEH